MGEKMSLQQVRDAMLEEKAWARGTGWPMAAGTLQRWADAIDAHLTQPAQAVDVVECDNCGRSDGCMCAHRGIGSGSFLCATCKQPVRTAALHKESNGAEG